MIVLQSALSQLADALWQARVRGQPCLPPTEIHPDLSIADAYRISGANFERRSRETGVRPVGRKIGLTSVAVQRQLGVDQPDFGYLTSDMLLDHEGVVRADALIQPRVEGEVALLLARDLRGPGVRFEDVIAATDHVVACIEIIDSRVRDWKIRIQDTVADNASSSMLVLGNRSRRLDSIDLRMVGMTLRKNGEVEATGVGAACLGHPVHAVAWLANALGVLGDGLRAGDIVLAGALGPVVPFLPGDVCEVEISGLGKVRCSMEGETRG